MTASTCAAGGIAANGGTRAPPISGQSGKMSDASSDVTLLPNSRSA